MVRGIGLDFEVVKRVLDFSVFRVMTSEQATSWFSDHYEMGLFHYSDNMSDVWRDIVGRLNEVGFQVSVIQKKQFAEVLLEHEDVHFKPIKAYGTSAPEAICLAAVTLVDKYPDVLKITPLPH